MNKLEISDSKLDKSEEKTFSSGKTKDLYNFTDENTKNNYNDSKNTNNVKLIHNMRGTNETYSTNLYGSITSVIIIQLIILFFTI